MGDMWNNNSVFYSGFPSFNKDCKCGKYCIYQKPTSNNCLECVVKYGHNKTPCIIKMREIENE
jgi:hypothetical protein